MFGWKGRPQGRSLGPIPQILLMENFYGTPRQQNLSTDCCDFMGLSTSIRETFVSANFEHSGNIYPQFFEHSGNIYK